MKFIKYLIALVAITPFLSSCLHSNLEDLPTYSDSKMTSLKAEFRYYGTQVWEGNKVVEYKVLPVKATPNDEALTLNAIVTIPAASGSFTTEIRNTVSLKNITVMAALSIAAKISPIGSAPPFGVPADWSASPYQYEVMAADGTKSVWTVTIALAN